MNETQKRILRIISALAFLAAIAGITVLLWPILRCFGQEGWQEHIREAIDSHGQVGGLLIFLAIQAMQVVVAVIPAVQAVGGMLYGWFFGAVLSYIGIVIGALAVWFIVRLLGRPLVEATIGEKQLKRFSFLQNEKKLTLILILLFLIPGIPKDVLTYIVPLTRVKMRDFFLIVLPFRIPSIVLTTSLGGSLTRGNYLAVILLAVLMLVIALLGLLFKDRILERLDHSKKDGEDRKESPSVADKE